ncbi:MAG: hypothetical protein Roseis2KO_30440 [Roseivirga sp.]
MLLISGFMLNGQQANIKSVQSIYNRPDQVKVKVKAGSQKANLLIDLSGLNLSGKPDIAEFLELVSENKVAALQPGNFRREESDGTINLAARKQLPDEFQIGETTYYKTIVELGDIEGKKLTTEVYLTSSENQELNPDMKLNFNWSSLKMDKVCKKPVCQEWKIKDGKAICKRMKCD